jgi:hypothetical protein
VAGGFLTRLLSLLCCTVQVLQLLKQEDPDRYARLEQLTGRTYSDVRDLYGANSSKEKRRAALANALAVEVRSSCGGSTVTAWLSANAGHCVCMCRACVRSYQEVAGVLLMGCAVLHAALVLHWYC